MKSSTALCRLLAVAVLTAGLGALAPAASAQVPVQLAPSSAADAYGLDVDITLPLNIPVNNGPRSRASQEFPPQAAAPSEDEELALGPIPSGGEAVQSIALLSSLAGANGTPQAVASSQAVGVALLVQNGTPMITADVIRAQSNSDCVNDPNATGTTFVNFRVAGIQDPIADPAPNTELLPQVFNPLGIKVVLNEQHPTADGRGLVVNAVHIYNYEPSVANGIMEGDIIVAHAMSTVNCPNGKGSTGANNPVFITKTASKSDAKPGDEVTYTATVQNKSSEPCLVNQFIEHMPTAFDLVSTSGAFGTQVESVNRPGGGVDVVLQPANVTIAAGATATQTFVLKVKDTAVPGVYFNNVEILCANLGNWVKGLDAPVRISTDIVDLAQCEDTIDNDGDGKVDFPVDPGCTSPKDDDERDQPRATLPRTGDTRELYVLAGMVLLAAAATSRRLAR